jgi:lipid-binding SYLF domain-containing protein
MRTIVIVPVLMLMTLLGGAALADSREDARLMEAKAVLSEWQAMPDQAIPQRLLDRAQGIAVFPSVVKAALWIGGRGGSGALVVKDGAGHWSNPSFVHIGGGSIGFQFGVETADVILVFTTRKGIEGVTGGKVTIGGNVSGAIGPVGRELSGSTDVALAEVYSYSRAKGLFAGVALDGSAITIDDNANGRYYGRAGILASEVFANAQRAPDTAARFVAEVSRLTTSAPAPGTAAAPAARTGAPAPTAAAAPEAKGLESGGAATFPLDDKNPKH